MFAWQCHLATSQCTNNVVAAFHNTSVGLQLSLGAISQSFIAQYVRPTPNVFKCKYSLHIQIFVIEKSGLESFTSHSK